MRVFTASFVVFMMIGCPPPVEEPDPLPSPGEIDPEAEGRDGHSTSGARGGPGREGATAEGAVPAEAERSTASINPISGDDEEPGSGPIRGVEGGLESVSPTVDVGVAGGDLLAEWSGSSVDLLSDEVRGMRLESSDEGPWMVRRGAFGGTMPERAVRGDAGGPAGEMTIELAAIAADSGVADAAAGGGRGAAPSADPIGSKRSEHKVSRDRDDRRVTGAPAPTRSAPGAEMAMEAPAAAIVVDAPAQIAASPLRAASTDDNADFEEFLAFLEEWGDRRGQTGPIDALDVSDRRFLRVVDDAGRPVPGASVALVDEVADRVVWRGTTYGDGSLPFYPKVAARERGAEQAFVAPEGGLLVDVTHGDDRARTRWNGIGEELVVEMAGRTALPATLPLDVMFVIDTTGSMGDEIDRIKGTLLRVTERLRGLEQEFDLHYSAVLYRDLGDEYVTKAHPFTGDIESFVETLQGVRANGGGDGPESLNQGLAHAVSLDGWREDAARVMFLIADASPHMDYEGDTPYGQSLLAAVDRGIRIHSVAASGLDPFGTVVFRQTAQFTGGQFIFIEYGGTAASAASHGVTGSVASNNLDDIIYEQIAGELSRYGQPPQAFAAR